LKLKELEEIEIEGNTEDVEKEIVKSLLGRIEIDFDEEKMVERLLDALNKNKEEGERAADFEERVWKDSKKVLGLHDS